MVIGKPGLGTYITATYPDKDTFIRALGCLAKYSDFIEIGIPTLNPKYDGPVIRMTHFKSAMKSLEAVRVVERVGVPMVLMGYVEDYVSRLDTVAQVAQEVGAVSVLFPDLIFEHIDMVEGYVNAMRDHGLYPTFFISSNTPHALISRLVKYDPLFVYMGLYAATGVKLPLYIERNVREVRRHLGEVFLVAGFAINSPDMVRLVINAGADAVVVGTAIVDKLGDESKCGGFLRWLRGGLP